MPFYSYILKSQKTGKFYKGHSQNLHQRLALHNSGKTKSTKNGIPWQLVFFECFKSRKEAIDREKYFKTAAGRRYIQTLQLSNPVEVPRPIRPK